MLMKNTAIIIPTRLEAKRFPNKPLAKINNIPIDKFCSKISKRISVYNSGVCKKYYGGPISQDIIFNALK